MSDIEKKAEIALCPFCGDWGAEVAESAVPSIQGGQKQAVYCNTCFCEGPTSETEKGAVEAWNRRAALTLPEGYVLINSVTLADLADDAEALIIQTEFRRDRIEGKLALVREARNALAARPEVSGG
jgi:Lar family restriction alleviation protein